MRRHRVIQLDDPPKPARSEPMNGAATDSWSKVQTICSPRTSAINVTNQNGYERRWREGDVLCIERQVTSEIPGRYGVEVRHEHSLRRVPACVDFKDIQESTTFEVDEAYSDRPWDYGGGFEHREIEIDWYVGHKALREGSRKPRGFYHGQRERGLLVLEDSVEQDCYSYHRDRGAAKQVARELMAIQCRRTLDQLVEWYADGWWWYVATCEFEGYEDSLCGFLSMDDEQYACQEVASTIARMMKDDGYTILNWSCIEDECVDSSYHASVEYRKCLRQNLNEQNWSYP